MPEASLLLSDEPHPERISPNDVITARMESFFFMVLPYSFIDNDSNKQYHSTLLGVIINKKGTRMGDYRGIPTCACPACGSHLLEITASFNPDTYEIEMYLLDNARCAMCQAHLTAPTPIDHPAA